MYRIGLPSSVGQPFSAPFFWALLGPNSCARHLGAFCFSVSSQEIFGNPTEDFSCPSRNAVPRSGSSGLSLLGAPEKWSRKRRHFHVLLELGNDRRICWGRPGAASSAEQRFTIHRSFCRDTTLLEKYRRRMGLESRVASRRDYMELECDSSQKFLNEMFRPRAQRKLQAALSLPGGFREENAGQWIVADF